MKRIISIILAAVTCLGTMSAVAFADEAEPMLGDSNGDNFVDNLDAALLLKYDAGIIDLDEMAITVSDVNYDGTADNLDAALLLKYDAGLISKFCVEHSFTEVTTCADEEVCTECGLKGAGIPHKWIAATCLRTKRCETCGKAEGGVDESKHVIADGFCSVCKTNLGYMASEALGEYVTEHNTLSGGSTYRRAKHFISEDENGTLYFVSNYHYSGTRTTAGIHYVFKEGGSVSSYFEYYPTQSRHAGEPYAKAVFCISQQSPAPNITVYSEVDMESFTLADGGLKNFDVVCYTHDVSSMYDELVSMAEEWAVLSVVYWDYFMTEVGIGYTTEDFGFVNFYE